MAKDLLTLNNEIQLATIEVCLSKSWGGLEMFVAEMAQRLSLQGNYGLIVRDQSPLHQEAYRRGIRCFPVKSKLNFLKKGRKIYRENRQAQVLVQDLRDLKWVRASLMGFENCLRGVSHSFVGVSKKDPLHRWAYSRASKIACLTESHRENLLKALPVSPEQLVVIPHGADIETFHPKHRDLSLRRQVAQDSQVLISVVGRLDPQKGQAELIQALGQVSDRQGFRLLVIGDETANEPGEKSKLEGLVKKLNLQEQVLFLPFQKNIERYFSILDVFVMPSYQETFGRVLVEAMASQIACVATNAGGVPSIARHEQEGLLVPPKNVEKLAQALERLISDPKLRQTLSENARRRAESEFDRRLTDQKWLAFLQSVG